MSTAYGYKLFRKDSKGNLHPLYVNASEILPMNTWMFAKSGERTENGKVKSKLGELAFRGGWHLNEEAPYVTHIYGKHYCENGNELEKNTGRRFDRVQKKDHVWCLVEYETTVDCQPNMFGTWIIAGNIRIVKELSETEVINKCAEYGLKPLPYEIG